MDYFEKLITGNSVHRVTEDDGITYGVRVLGRGENMFFQKGAMGLVCLIDIQSCVIERESIKEWHDGTKISEVERELLLPEIVKLFERFYCKGKRAVVK